MIHDPWVGPGSWEAGAVLEEFLPLGTRVSLKEWEIGDQRHSPLVTEITQTFIFDGIDSHRFTCRPVTMYNLCTFALAGLLFL
jgi:hypothetical protein